VSKRDLLQCLAQLRDADAAEVAVSLEVPYVNAAMGLLRLARQGLAIRYEDPDTGLYRYALSAHGRARLAYFKANS
jgi:hypothetical protein